MKMKHFILLLCFLITNWICKAQEILEAKTLPDNQIIVPYKLEVTFSKTVHILFPNEVKYIDLGSTNIIAGKAN